MCIRDRTPREHMRFNVSGSLLISVMEKQDQFVDSRVVRAIRQLKSHRYAPSKHSKVKLKTLPIFSLDSGERMETADTSNGKTCTGELTVAKKKSMPMCSQPMLGTASLVKEKALTVAKSSVKIAELLKENNTDFDTINEELEKDKIYPSCKIGYLIENSGCVEGTVLIGKFKEDGDISARADAEEDYCDQCQ
eukprot:TRINITY_DN12309_c0_g1_i1.p1 TRINITY_DN12309_c0_g1~~TRINITY_DN12309_c0_g1_i1.p1  ORF type:complete len:193 (+),score=32.80 TRINITY_DN12309_c0_g1_i1:64-642(+)